MRQSERVIVIGWGGAGIFVKDANTPNLDRYVTKGTFTFETQTESPTISAECWGSLLHGVMPDKHGLTNEKADQDTYPADSPYPSFFRVTREAWPDAKLAAFSAWRPINSGIIEARTACSSSSPTTAAEAKTSTVTAAITWWTKRSTGTASVLASRKEPTSKRTSRSGIRRPSSLHALGA